MTSLPRTPEIEGALAAAERTEPAAGLEPLAHRVALLRGWRRALLGIAAGAVGALAMPPFGLLPALVLSLVPAVWLLDGHGVLGRRALRGAALDGWCWGFGYFVAGFWWLGAAFLVEADQFAWAMPFGVLGLPALLAFFPALGFALARLLWREGALRILALAVGLTVAEGLRGTLFTGFPWNTIGMALGQQIWLMQAASLAGLYGLTLLAVLIAAAPATLLTGGSPAGRLAPAALALALLGGLVGFGALRVPAEAMPTEPGIRLRIMQPNLPQDAKFNPANAGAILRHYLDVSGRATERSPGIAGVTHLIWPESAFPFLLHREPQALAQIAAFLPPGTTLVTGAARMETPLPGESAGRFFNAIQVVGEDGRIGGTYDKAHLVPFGEYVPHALDSLMRAVGLRQFVHIPGGFDAGEPGAPLAVPGLPPVAASVCYEAIFPGALIGAGPRPSLMLNVTNDAWFGNTPGPRQHFAQARLRTVEEGLPLVRAANTGISAVIDPYGRVVAALDLGKEGALDADLPRPAGPTLFAALGSFIPTAMVLACLLPLVTLRRRPRPLP
ncbi:MAG TPA: apolipoprotein N-acyltransferase [Microvirga sp.]|jgi:apolipoprotein N-acyltransferase